MKYHVSMLILPFRVSQNTFQNNCSKFKVPQLLILPENFFKGISKAFVNLQFQLLISQKLEIDNVFSLLSAPEAY